jgi:FdhE protein
VNITPFQRRLRRAEHLTARYPFAAEVLGFYIQAARFQEGLYQRIENSSARVPPAVLREEEWASRALSGPQNAGATRTLLVSFPQFLSLVEQEGPARLAEIAHEMRNSSSSSWPDLFTRCWTNIDSPIDAGDFLVLAFLQPYAEFARLQAAPQLEGYTHPLCPFCHRKPALGILRQQGDGARRSLLCGFCLTEWDFRRVVCPGCGQEDHAKLPVYSAETFPHIRVECCDTCQTYIKSIDLTKNGLADPLVDELASIPLNLWAQEHGYLKLHPNLLGM